MILTIFIFSYFFLTCFLLHSYLAIFLWLFSAIFLFLIYLTFISLVSADSELNKNSNFQQLVFKSKMTLVKPDDTLGNLPWLWTETKCKDPGGLEQNALSWNRGFSSWNQRLIPFCQRLTNYARHVMKGEAITGNVENTPLLADIWSGGMHQPHKRMWVLIAGT